MTRNQLNAGLALGSVFLMAGIVVLAPPVPPASAQSQIDTVDGVDDAIVGGEVHRQSSQFQQRFTHRRASARGVERSFIGPPRSPACRADWRRPCATDRRALRR